jgi:hypothetical protein
VPHISPCFLRGDVGDADLDLVGSFADLKNLMTNLKSGDAVVLRIERDGLLSFLPFRFEE